MLRHDAALWAARMTNPSRLSPELLADRLEFETLISDTSAALLTSSAGQVQPSVERALDRLRHAFRADRCAILSVSADQRIVKVMHSSDAESVPAVPSELNLAEAFPWARQRLLVDRLPVHVARPEELPPEAASDLPAWAHLGLRSALTLPIEAEGDVRHLIVIQAIHAEREWPDRVIPRLRVLGELLVGTLARSALITELRRSETRQSLGAELAGLAYYEVDLGRGVAYVDDRLRDTCGIPPERMQGLQPVLFWTESIHPDDRPRVLELREQLHDGRLRRLSVEYRYLHPTRGPVWLNHLAGVLERDASERAVVTYGVLRDVTDRKVADEALASLSRRLIRSHEDERAFLARELHDDLSQRIAALAIEVGRTERALEGTHADALRTVRCELASLGDDVHALAYHLHPSILEDLGLGAALQAACESFSRAGGTPLLDLLEVPPTLGKDEALCLFRVTQEALSNVRRHASARVARVALRQQGRGLLLEVRDDGIGFEPSSPRSTRSLGLESMRERTRLLGGTFDIQSAPGQGTTVTAWVPVQGESP